MYVIHPRLGQGLSGLYSFTAVLRMVKSYADKNFNWAMNVAVTIDLL
jgi:hypothetical protein